MVAPLPPQPKNATAIDDQVADGKVNITHLAHMVYAHKDLANIKKFLLDFGMVVVDESDERIYFRGYGSQPYVYVAEKASEREFRGGCWAVKSRADLDRAAKLAGATTVKPLQGPGGGYEVALRDPDGFPFRLVWGQTLSPPGSYPDKLTLNYEKEKPRVGEFQRFQMKPAAVHKLGHYGLGCSNFEQTYGWLTEHFNFKASDIMVDDNDKDVGAFMRINLGDDYSDHHSFFFMELPKQQVHHCSFEVHDFDTQQIGHQYLDSKGYELCWGVGRHILGSQIFDYWFDPESHFMIEHYCDGDILNDSRDTARVPAKDELLSVWGPDLPATFLPHK